jgi:hypothetical protein
MVVGDCIITDLLGVLAKIGIYCVVVILCMLVIAENLRPSSRYHHTEIAHDLASKIKRLEVQHAKQHKLALHRTKKAKTKKLEVRQAKQARKKEREVRQAKKAARYLSPAPGCHIERSHRLAFGWRFELWIMFEWWIMLVLCLPQVSATCPLWTRGQPPHFTECVLAVCCAFSYFTYAVRASILGRDGDESGIAGESDVTGDGVGGTYAVCASNFGGEGDEISMTDHPAGGDTSMQTTMGPSAPRNIVTGKKYWYRDPEGVVRKVEVIAIDHSVDPRSFRVQFGHTVCETDANGLFDLFPMSDALLGSFPVPEAATSMTDSPISDQPRHLVQQVLQKMRMTPQVVSPSQDNPEATGAWCHFAIPRVNLYAYIKSFFAQAGPLEEDDGQVHPPEAHSSSESRARRFLDSKATEMSETSRAAEFCELSISHECTSNAQPPYPQWRTNMAMIGTYPVAGPLMHCATFRHWLVRLGLVGFQVPIVDCIPYMHSDGAGKFIFNPKFARNEDVQEWFWERIMRLIARLQAAQSTNKELLTPVLYVCREVFFIFEGRAALEQVPEMGGDVFTAKIGSGSVLIIRGKHPSPRGWAGDGMYKEYMFFVNVFKACLMNPKSPGTALAQLAAEDLANVTAAMDFFRKKQVDLEALRNWPGKASCFHRPLSFRVAAWDSVTATAAMLVVHDSTIVLTPLQTACLSLQMHDIPEVVEGIRQFGSELRNVNIVVKNNASLARVMGAIVRHSNGLAFVDEAALAPTAPGSDSPMCRRVKNLVTDLTNDLHIGTRRIAAVLIGMTSRASRCGDFVVLARSLTTAKIETSDWHGLLSVPGAIRAIEGGLLETAIAELHAAQIAPKVRINYAGKVQISSKIVISVK